MQVRGKSCNRIIYGDKGVDDGEIAVKSDICACIYVIYVVTLKHCKKREAVPIIFWNGLSFCFELFEKRLFTQSECFYNCTITLDVFFLEIVEHAASFADKLNQCSVSAIIFMIDLHVLGQTADTV